MAANTEFDREAYFQKECQPLLKELHEQCILGGIPYFWTACVKNGGGKSEYVSDGMLTGSAGIHLDDDHIKRHLLVSCGFDVTSEKRDVEIMMDDPDDI